MDNDWTTWNSTPNQTWYTSGSPEQLHYVPSNLQAPHAQVRKTAKWNHFEHKAFIETCELVIAEGHRRGKCFSMKGWHRVAEMFNASTGKDWTTTQMKNYWNKLRMEHKHCSSCCCTGIEYCPGTDAFMPLTIGGNQKLRRTQSTRNIGNARERSHRRFRNARERFNFHHSSCRNVIERAFGVWKQRWKIIDRMPAYNMRAQTAVVVATMGIHNFLRRNGRLDEGFRRAEELDDEDVEIDLPDEADEIAAELDVISEEDMLWQQLRDYLAQTLR